MEVKKSMKELEEEIRRLKTELADTRTSYQQQVEEIKNNQMRIARHEELLRSVVEAAAGKIGQDFFDNIIIRLSEWIGAECVLIGRMVEHERIEAVPLLLDGKISHGFSYNLKGSPCAITTRRGYCCYTENVIEEFPSDQILVDLQAEAYIGTALYNNRGETNGVICAVSRKKMEVPPFANEILAIVGARVTAEIERQKTEEELRKSEKELLASNQTKDKFFSLIAHDLRSPVNALSGFSELMHRNYGKYSRKKHEKYIEHIYLSANKIRNLLNNLLTWALSQQGMIKYDESSLSLNEIVTDSVELAEFSAKSKNIKIQVNLQDELKVIGDRNMISTILRNLISNAIKYSPNDSSITIEGTMSKSEHNGKVIISVGDSGVGIPEEQINALFQPDSGMSTPGTQNEEGTGLGLIICKEFIEILGEKIWVESQPQSGSRFSFSLKDNCPSKI